MIELRKLHVALVIGKGESFKLFVANDPGNIPESGKNYPRKRG